MACGTPKGDDKPPFQSRAEIERQLPGLPEPKASELCETLYLTAGEVEHLLAYVKAHAAHPWIHPLLTTAAHTGARRAELLRMRVADLDLSREVVSIRERKRVHSRRTTRRVPRSTTLSAVLTEWLRAHPGGAFLFAQADMVGRSRKRSANTGHRGKNRPTTEEARQSGVQERQWPGILQLTQNEAHHHLKRTLAGSEWAIVHVYHILRHSFISACTSRGVDQRLIDEWVGHQSEEQRRRYRHVYPSVQADAIKSVFG